MVSITSNKGTCEPVPRNSVTANKITLPVGQLSSFSYTSMTLNDCSCAKIHLVTVIL
jgi:hypothetical protein